MSKEHSRYVLSNWCVGIKKTICYNDPCRLVSKIGKVALYLFILATHIDYTDHKIASFVLYWQLLFQCNTTDNISML